MTQIANKELNATKTIDCTPSLGTLYGTTATAKTEWLRKAYDCLYVNGCTTKAVTETKPKVAKVKKVIFNNPATIIFWDDKTKTVVKCQDGDTFDKEKGFVMAYLKKMLGNKNEFNKEIHKWVKEESK